MLKFSTTNRPGDITVLKLEGELDPYTAQDFLDGVADLIEKGNRKIVVDCNNLSYISSLGLGALVRVHARMKKRGGDVKVTGLKGPVADVFRVTMLYKVFSMYESVDEAAAAFE